MKNDMIRIRFPKTRNEWIYYLKHPFRFFRSRSRFSINPFQISDDALEKAVEIYRDHNDLGYPKRDEVTIWAAYIRQKELNLEQLQKMNSYKAELIDVKKEISKLKRGNKK